MNVRRSAEFAVNAFIVLCLGTVYAAGLTVQTRFGWLATLRRAVKETVGGRRTESMSQR